MSAPAGLERPATERPEYETFRKRRRRAFTLTAEHVRTLALFFAFFVFYLGLGYRVVVVQHVVPFDAVARLAHAYFVWWNQPPKLAAIGFVWPPLSTLVFLPAAAVRGLAASLAALPLTTAFFGALLIVLLDRTLAVARLHWAARLPLLLAFGLNPMIVFYAVNGMSEVVYLCFLVAGAYFFLRWFLTREARFLTVAALAFAFGVLSRYEVITWALLVVLALGAAMIRQHVVRSELEGSLIAYLAPVVYALGLWLFVNWLILGNPLFFLSQQAPGFAQATPTNPAPSPTGDAHLSVATIAGDLVDLNWRLFPLTIVVTVALVLAFLVRRDLMAITIAAFIALNAFFTGVLMWATGNAGLLQLRYNMRAMPLAVVGVAWLVLTTRGRRGRAALWAGALAALVLSVPSTWRTMQTYPYQFLEQAFTRAISTGRDQEGKVSIGGYVAGIGPEQRMADWIRANVHERDAILTDDAQSFAVLLLSGRPDLFWDRIDRGDAQWLAALDDPFGKVSYLLVSNVSGDDAARFRWPALFTTGERGMQPVYSTSHFTLFRVAGSRPPRIRLRGGETAGDRGGPVG